MNEQDLYDGVTEIRDDLIDGARAPLQQKKRPIRWPKKRWLSAAAAVLALVLLGNLFSRPGLGLTAYAIAEAQYPKMARCPSGVAQLIPPLYDRWRRDVLAQRRDLGDTADLETFFAKSAPAFLRGAGGENRIYSPLNVYMALAMLAQLTEGESRAQVLAALGGGSADALRQRANDIWNSSYRDDGVLTSILASSLWLSEDVTYDKAALDTLASDCYVSSYRGEMGSEKYSRALQRWLSAQTGGLLEGEAGGITMDPDTVFTLAATVSFQGKWVDEFSKGETRQQTFHAPDGDREADFMHQREAGAYYWGDHFAAVSQSFRMGGAMWFLLPDEGVSPEELLADDEALAFLFAADHSEWENQKYLFINKAIPKFDLTSQLDLSDGLRALGVTDLFDPASADFSALTANGGQPVWLDQASHAVRVTIDEEGCTAAAFTALQGAGAAAPPDDEVDLVLDRPFLFCITGVNGLPLFVGVVNQP